MTQNEKAALKAYAYTPGLKVKRAMLVRKTRRLPLVGEVLVEKNTRIDFDTIVARTMVPGDPHIIKVANLLDIEPEEIDRYLTKKEGSSIEKDEMIAKYTAFFGLSKRFVTSPVKGVIENVSRSTGRIVVREPLVPVEVKAYIPGKIVEVLPNEGVVIETNAAFIQGIFGVGGEAHGQLQVAVESPTEVLTPDRIDDEYKGRILVGGSQVTSEALLKALKVGVRGVLVGSIDDAVLTNFLGYKIGVALTGEEDIDLTLIITEGFGKMNMSQKTFEILKSLNGLDAAVNGATQIRAGVLRPEIIIPTSETLSTSTEDSSLEIGMIPGTGVRIIRDPFFGRIGKVISLPIKLQRLETESKVRVVRLELEDGIKVIVPRANVEIIEE